MKRTVALLFFFPWDVGCSVFWNLVLRLVAGWLLRKVQAVSWGGKTDVDLFHVHKA